MVVSTHQRGNMRGTCTVLVTSLCCVDITAQVVSTSAAPQTQAPNVVSLSPTSTPTSPPTNSATTSDTSMGAGEMAGVIVAAIIIFLLIAIVVARTTIQSRRSSASVTGRPKLRRKMSVDPHRKESVEMIENIMRQDQDKMARSRPVQLRTSVYARPAFSQYADPSGFGGLKTTESESPRPIRTASAGSTDSAAIAASHATTTVVAADHSYARFCSSRAAEGLVERRVASNGAIVPPRLSLDQPLADPESDYESLRHHPDSRLPAIPVCTAGTPKSSEYDTVEPELQPVESPTIKRPSLEEALANNKSNSLYANSSRDEALANNESKSLYANPQPVDAVQPFTFHATTNHEAATHRRGADRPASALWLPDADFDSLPSPQMMTPTAIVGRDVTWPSPHEVSPKSPKQLSLI
eukprot:m.9088 g.9088  ORF g.9088 m.9088 type:complete len:411 (-) comp4136_c0_seq2:1199-2431(-)